MIKSWLILLKLSAADAFKIASKRGIQKTAEATGDHQQMNIALK